MQLKTPLDSFPSLSDIIIDGSDKNINKSYRVDLRPLKKGMDYTFYNGKPKGEKTHFPPIDSIRNFTWKKGLLYCITGNPASGKSEFMNHLLTLKARVDNWKWLAYSPESYPVEDFVDTLIHGYVGKSTDPQFNNHMSKAEYDDAFEFVVKHFEILDFPEMPTLTQIKSAVNASTADGAIIDPFNAIDTREYSGELISEMLKMSLTAMRTMAAKSKKALVVVEHPKSGSRIDEQTKQPKAPTEYDLYGGSMWHNKCDVIGVVHRPFVRDNSNTQVEFTTLKIKNQKLHGYPDTCSFHFDRGSGRYFYIDKPGEQATAYDILPPSTSSSQKESKAGGYINEEYKTPF